ncbi:MAG: CidA/LrgA family protein [Solibacillus sp.]
MQVVRVIAQIGILTVYYLIGDFIVKATGLIIPGSIIGLVLLWLSLYFKILPTKFIQEGVSFLLAFLTLFFIPSTVAVINYPELLTKTGVLLMVAVIISTIFTLVVTGKVSQYIEKRENRQEVKSHGANNARAADDR